MLIRRRGTGTCQLLLLAGLALAVASCCDRSYTGSGLFIDHGCTAANDRFVLDLGPAHPGQTEYAIGRLPHVEFTVGLELSSTSDYRAVAQAARMSDPVSVTLLTERRSPIFSQMGLLKDWTWTRSSGATGSFAYVQKNGAGPGTYFTPGWFRTHRLIIRAPEDAFILQQQPHVVLRSGGWK